MEQSFMGFSQLLLVLLLQLVPAQMPPIEKAMAKQAENSLSTISANSLRGNITNLTVKTCSPGYQAACWNQIISSLREISPPPGEGLPKGMSFQEVWAKSICHPMEQLVDVEQEFPGEVAYIYMPACVPLKRCAGCCGDEHLECHPTLERNITLQMMKIAPVISSHVELTFVEHLSCDCRPRQILQKHKSSSESIRNKHRRRKHKKTANGCGKCQFPQNKINLH